MIKNEKLFLCLMSKVKVKPYLSLMTVIVSLETLAKML